MNFNDYISEYKCDALHNNSIFEHFTEQTIACDFLFKHRSYVESHKLGFGDKAFHYMWFLILQEIFSRTDRPHFFEIGVYKGQVISLWALIAKHFAREYEISCVTPLSGNVSPVKDLRYYWKFLINSDFRSQMTSGNFYEDKRYLDAIASLFDAFDLNFRNVKIYEGLSSDPEILAKLSQSVFDIVYVDGDHSKAAVKRDIRNFAPKIRPGGFLVMDDAACNIPGGENNQYWKGHKSVSDACKEISQSDFENVLNVGHNRIFRKRG